MSIPNNLDEWLKRPTKVIGEPRPPCPCCGMPLTVQVTVFCARGACSSDVANDGATSDTIDKAVEKLAEMVNDEAARKENE